ncbi:MAG: glycosyltransferase [Rubrobacteraceae bacterium]
MVIPTYNAGPGFAGLLESISGQEVDLTQEVLVVDSGSADGTVDVARSQGAAVHQIPKSEFNHGATRNLGISLSSGEYVALVVQDARPLDEGWLGAMVENLEQDGRVAGVYGRQVPHPGSGALTRALTGNLLAAASERREQYAGGPEAYRRLSPEQQWRLAAFDNVSSCLRRSVWEEIPFDETNFAEDLRWGKKVVEAGYKLVYEPRSAVFHSHERGAMYDLRRYYVNARVLSELFGLEPVRNVPRLFLSIALSTLHLYGLLRKSKAFGGKARPLMLAAAYAGPTQLGSYLGVKVPRLSRISPGLSSRLDRFLGKGI